jgi:large subunit ribosomal protein L7e
MPSAFVPESVLKKRRTTAALATAKDAADKAATKKAAVDKEAMMKRAESYVAEYKALENDSIRLRREAKASGSYYVPAEPKLAFVTRIRGASFPRVDLVCPSQGCLPGRLDSTPSLKLLAFLIH